MVEMLKYLQIDLIVVRARALPHCSEVQSWMEVAVLRILAIMKTPQRLQIVTTRLASSITLGKPRCLLLVTLASSSACRAGLHRAVYDNTAVNLINFYIAGCGMKAMPCDFPLQLIEFLGLILGSVNDRGHPGKLR